MSKRTRRPQASKVRQFDPRGLRVALHEVVRCPTGTLGYSRSVALAMTRNSPDAQMDECLKCDAYHVKETP